MSRYKDFDIFFAEMQRTPVTFSFAGKDYLLPSELPAAVGLECARLRMAGRGDEDVPPGSLETMAKALLGEENFARLVSDGASLNQLGEILKWVMEEYQQGDHQSGKIAGPGPRVALRDEEQSRSIEALRESRGRIDLIERWSLVEADFQREYGIDLAAALCSMSWRRFIVPARGLSGQSRTAQSAQAGAGRRVIADAAAAERAVSAAWGL